MSAGESDLQSPVVDLFVFGTGGQARELAHVIGLTASVCRWRFAGYVAPTVASKGQAVDASGPVVGVDEEVLALGPAARAAIGIGRPPLRAALRRRLHDQGLLLPTVIHPQAIVDRLRVAIGDGCYLGAGSVLTVDVTIHPGAMINFGASVGHDAVIGEDSVVNPGARISGGVRLGRSVLVGAGATVLETISVGDGATVGAGAVVTKDVEPGDTVVGVPARSMRLRN